MKAGCRTHMETESTTCMRRRHRQVQGLQHRPYRPSSPILDPDQQASISSVPVREPTAYALHVAWAPGSNSIGISCHLPEPGAHIVPTNILRPVATRASRLAALACSSLRLTLLLGLAFGFGQTLNHMAFSLQDKLNAYTESSGTSSMYFSIR